MLTFISTGPARVRLIQGGSVSRYLSGGRYIEKIRIFFRIHFSPKVNNKGNINITTQRND